MPAAQFEDTDWYNTPLYYDIIFAADTESECDFLEGVQRQYGKTPGKRVLEPACGSGRLVEAMALRGYAVTGFDINAPMLAFARQRLQDNGLQAELLEARMERFDVAPGFDLAHCFVSTFKYLLDEASAQAHLQGVADALAPGGLYVLGFHLSDYSSTQLSRERWFGSRGALSVLCNIQSWPPERAKRLEKVRSRLTVKNRRQVKKLETTWLFRTYSVTQMRQLLGKVPALDHVATYDFTYNLQRPRIFDGKQLDCVLILRKN